ncbi:protein kinase domain-containing protein [Bailinhaonella thermotolerans]|uniref:protein kinase domain-containing protein n=1 Tax=Bailinhaonella thermotolerans TaxID=1070861 RepID=UPI00192A23DB|nr:caspase family protein [Bailinhaonella thermotolerans]
MIVGLDHYVSAPALQGCEQDAKDMATCLSFDQYDFDSKILLNGQATRSKILQSLSEIAYSEAGGEILLFYFAGHGQVLGQAGHLVTYDSQPFDPGISLSHLAQIMESASLRFRHVVSILDCCHAGAAFTWTGSRPLQSGDIEREVLTVNESRCVLAACRPEQVALELPEGAGGVFTRALTEGLLDAAVNWDGEVTLLSLFEYISEAIPKEFQTPVFKGDIAGTVVLGKGFTPRQGRQIDRGELLQTLAKAHHLVDQYHHLQLRELSERNIRLRQGSKICSAELESIVGWFDETERSLADLRRNQDWVNLTGRVREFRKNLADLSPGEETRYGRVLRHLGHGGYGHVWEIEGADGKLYAMKLFHGNELDDEVKVQRFTNGYHNMRKLQHPRIVRVHSLMHAPFGFVMDAIPGENLRSHIGNDNPELILRLMIDICETVQHAHSQKVKHRDIKPENIIIVRSDDDRFTPYLTDFDLAYHETNRTVTTNIGVGGVINYAAPEQLFEPNAKHSRSETVDVFSLAQLMYFLVTGRDPSGENFDRNKQILTRELGSWIDDRAAAILIDLYTRSTSKTPAERPQSVVEFVTPLRNAESLIHIASGSDQIDEDDLCRRVGHAYAGLKQYTCTEDNCRMTSPSGQIEIIVRLKDVRVNRMAVIEIEFSVIDKIPVPGFKTGKSARESINMRLDKIFPRSSNVRRHPGNKGAYQVFMIMEKVPLDVKGLARITEVISKTVAGIEQW